MRALSLLVLLRLSSVLAEDDTCQPGTACMENTDVSSAFIQSSRITTKREERIECTDSTCLKPAWNVNTVDEACSGDTGSHGSLLEVNTTGSLIPHWSIRRFSMDGSATMLYYGSADFKADVPNAATLAVVSMHGASRDAINYFCTLKGVIEAQSGYDISEVLMIAPKFAYQEDLASAPTPTGDDEDDEPEGNAMDEVEQDAFDPLPTDLWWNGSKDNPPFGDYRLGAHSDPSSGGSYSSFEVLDSIVNTLEESHDYPNLREILIMGHSAGGQVVQRYALTTHLAPRDHGVKIRYAVANPSSYAYLDKKRWKYECGPNGCTDATYGSYTQSKGRRGWKWTDGRRRRSGEISTPPEHSATEQRRRGWDIQDRGFWATEKKGDDPVERPFPCGTSKSRTWGYELRDSGDTVPYIANNPRDNAIQQMKEWYKLRDVVYFVGAMDTCTDDFIPGTTIDGNYYCDANCWTRDYIPDIARFREKCYRNRMDMRCEGMLQGPNRKERGLLYYKHLQAHYGEEVHKIYVIDGVGHDSFGMFSSPTALSELFPGLTSHHAAGKCRANGNPDPDCCSARGVGQCADDHQMVVTGSCGGSSSWCRQNGCDRYECIPPTPAYSLHEADKCKDWAGGADTDCCSAAGSSCADGYQKVVTGLCGQGNQWCRDYGCYAYLCLPA